ncbi:MAG: patatin-like phospholipase family protein [Bacteroidota bacterium]|nr:patatin-like phospholipase family protein [Bacteroidota bacterium]
MSEHDLENRPTTPPPTPRRALVLGGGGITGIAWEIGVLAGLRAAGVDLSGADAVIGTSAGAFVGAAVASGYDLDRLFAAQSEPSPAEVAATASAETMQAWYGAFAAGGTNPARIGAALGEIAKNNPEPVPAAQRRAAIEGRLVTTAWPLTLQITAINADSGELHVFDQAAGVALVDAVSASGAVPGVWPLVHLNGQRWIDGGMVSTANAGLATGYERVVVLAPLPAGNGPIPGAAADVQALSAAAQVLLIAPDEASVAAIGPNIYDPSRRAEVAAAGRRQGSRLAAAVQAVW